MKTALFALTLLASSVPALALACSCMEPGATWFVAPEDGAVDVPVNALVWAGGGMTRGLFEGEDKFAIEVLDDQGVVLPGIEGRLNASMEVVDVFTPDFALQPNHTYSVRINDTVHSTFTTGEAVDVEAPQIPEETERDSWSNPPTLPDGFSCGGGQASHGVSFGFDMNGSVLVLLDNDGAADVDVELIEGSLPAMSVFGFTSIGNGFACGGDNWEGAGLGATTDVRYASFDVAGNFSGWSEDETVKVTPRGCSAAGGSSPVGIFALLGLGGLAAVRRRS
ncbi:MAG: hypothetical protein KDA24_12895 [Deltaproteobacteria bacterium]|nr:hypothetical protein [Deltaproteobacteria bacterium]